MIVLSRLDFPFRFWKPPRMQRLARQVIIRLVIVIAIAVGLVRPPFGSDVHAAQTAGSHNASVKHADDHARSSHAGHNHDQDDDSSSLHDATDHCHVPSGMPPSVTTLTLSSEFTRLAEREAASMNWTTISFERPPRPTIFV